MRFSYNWLKQLVDFDKTKHTRNSIIVGLVLTSLASGFLAGFYYEKPEIQNNIAQVQTEAVQEETAENLVAEEAKKTTDQVIGLTPDSADVKSDARVVITELSGNKKTFTHSATGITFDYPVEWGEPEVQEARDGKWKASDLLRGNSYYISFSDIGIWLSIPTKDFSYPTEGIFNCSDATVATYQEQPNRIQEVTKQNGADLVMMNGQYGYHVFRKNAIILHPVSENITCLGAFASIKTDIETDIRLRGMGLILNESDYGPRYQEFLVPQSAIDWIEETRVKYNEPRESTDLYLFTKYFDEFVKSIRFTK